MKQLMMIGSLAMALVACLQPAPQQSEPAATSEGAQEVRPHALGIDCLDAHFSCVNSVLDCRQRGGAVVPKSCEGDENPICCTKD